MTLWDPFWLVKANRVSSREQRKDLDKVPQNFSSQSVEKIQRSTKPAIEASSWKPVTLRPPFLLGIVVVTLVFIALLEYLSQRSRLDGGIAFTTGEFSTAVSFAYLYLPTMIAVLYSILWSWIDLDTKRLEPYFQLSRPEGADRMNSLALNYPFDFVAYAPLKALRRRHWAVVFAGLSTMLIFWGVTPLVSSVFAHSIVTVDQLATKTSNSDLMSLKEQSSAMNTGFMMTAYGIIWLGQAMPGFVTSQGFIQPFQLDTKREVQPLNATWKARTTLYGTSLNCWAANVKNDSAGISYSDGRNCTAPTNTPLSQETDSTFGALYIGYESDQHADYYLSNYLNCPPSPTKKHLFFAIWGQTSGSDHVTDQSAAFCEPTYWTQQVNATVTVPGMNVTEVSPLGPRVTLPDEVFNRTAFEYGIGTGAQQVFSRADIAETTNIIDQKSKIAKFGFLDLVTNMVGFAIGLNPTNMTNAEDTTVLAASFESAHKLLHALAVRQLMNTKVIDPERSPGTIRGKIRAITIVRPLAIAVEILSGLVVMLVIALMIYTYMRPSQLRNNPASLADVIAIAADDDGYGYPDYTNEHGSTANQPQFCLLNGRICVPQPLITSQMASPGSPSNDAKPSPAKPESRDRESLVRPREMKMTVAFVFLLTILLALVSIITLMTYARKYHGLPVPSNSTVVNQIVLNYVLVVFATFLEPFWLLLNRQLCILQPFEELRQANAYASRSLKLTYASLPPQMNLWNALRARHLVLGAVCAIGLSANLLAISLNGLLQIDLGLIAEELDLKRLHEPNFSQDQIPQASSDHQYLAKANISDGVTLPPWMTADTFFVSFDVNSQSKYGTASSIRASTHGFRLRPICVRTFVNDTALITGKPDRVYVQQSTPSGGSVFCGGFTAPFGGQNKSNAAAEIFTRLIPIDPNRADTDQYEQTATMAANATAEEILTCGSILVAGFLRANLTVSVDNFRTDNTDSPPIQESPGINSLSSLWMMCKSSIASAPYEVTVDLTGRIQSYEATGPEVKNAADAFSNGTSPESFINQTTFALDSGADISPYWHNDTFVDTWFAYFIKKLSNSTMFVDPELPVPAIEHVGPHVENLYARLFAIILAQNQQWLVKADAKSTIRGVLLASSQRVFVSRPMFIITVTLLGLNIMVAILYWARRPKRMLPKMPYTIGSILAMVHASGLKLEARKQEEWKKDWRFGYGRFVGTDGTPHVGIERRPFVQPLDT
ncbi:MAG: hypothetical protein Q9168_002353 [Polycauliona sp. 1 TL-2023]